MLSYAANCAATFANHDVAPDERLALYYEPAGGGTPARMGELRVKVPVTLNSYRGHVFTARREHDAARATAANPGEVLMRWKVANPTEAGTQQAFDLRQSEVFPPEVT